MGERLRRFLALGMITLLLGGCASPSSPTTEALSGEGEATAVTLNIFAAASLSDAFGEMGETFHAANPTVELVFNFAGSNQLATQIAQGAPADLFAAANEKQMAVAVASGRIVDGSEQIFAHNRLVLITPKENPANLHTLQALANSGMKVVFAAAEVPVGQYSLDFLDQAAVDPTFGPDYKDRVLANLVSYEANVRAVLTKVVLGEADAGIVYTSDIGVDSDVREIPIPDALNSVANYPIAPLVDSAQRDRAGQFIAYVLSPAGQAIMARHGFLPVGEE